MSSHTGMKKDVGGLPLASSSVATLPQIIECLAIAWFCVLQTQAHCDVRVTRTEDKPSYDTF